MYEVHAKTEATRMRLESIGASRLGPSLALCLIDNAVQLCAFIAFSWMLIAVAS